MKEIKAIGEEELKAYPGLENLTEDEAKQYLFGLNILATLIVEHLIRIENQNTQAARVAA